MTITDIIEKIESITAFGDIPAYSASRRGSKIAVCRNNGAFHTDPAWSGSRGWATFLGYYTKAEAYETFLGFNPEEERT